MTQATTGEPLVEDYESRASHGLNLHLPLADPRRMPELLLELKETLRDPARKALTDLHFVHFARFLPTRDQTALLVVTVFDGPLDAYILDFIIAVSDVFDAILKYVKDAPPLPVKEYPDEFMDFVRKYNAVLLAPNTPYFEEYYPLYSAYPDHTVLDIVRKRREPLVFEDARAEPVPVADVQGNLLHGFRAPRARHYALRITDAAVGREFLRLLVDGDGSVVPKVTSEQAWRERPAGLHCFLTVGVSSDGLKALGVPRAVRERMPRVFREGPADPDRAERNGDVGSNAPANWKLGRPGEAVHLMVSVYEARIDPAGQAAISGAFRKSCHQLEHWLAANGIEVVGGEAHEAQALPGSRVHFGYIDGISQPRVAGAEPHDYPGAEKQPLARAGDFLLGSYPGVYGGRSLRSMPAELCRNGTFAAVRVMQQDVRGFEDFLDRASQAAGIDREWLAAKLMGRWRTDGSPLSADVASAQDPKAGASGYPTPPGSTPSNDFDYGPSKPHPAVDDDDRGLICPVGAHMRRMNPRSALVAGTPHTHRLVRRGMPYGGEWDGLDTGERGLFGIFLCADLERQYEFLLQQWARGEPGLQRNGSQDPLLGVGDEGADFHIPLEGKPPITVRVPKLLTTRGSVYLLMPGLDGLRWLARGTYFEQPDAAPADPDLRSFDPVGPGFLADPYAWYRKFRNEAPVALVRHGHYESYWVFTHELVTQVCDNPQLFPKRPAAEQGPRGLFFMDSPRHGQVRGIMDPLFTAAIAQVATTARDEAQKAIAAIQGSASASFDLIAAYSRPVTRNVFMAMMGIPSADWQKVGAWIEELLDLHGDWRLERDRRQAGEPGAQLALYFAKQAQLARCPMHAGGNPGAIPLFPMLCKATLEGRLQEQELVQSAIHFALGGYLSTDFLVGTGIHRLLTMKDGVAQFLALDEAGRKAAIEEMMRFDAPFQLADRVAATDVQLAGCHIPAGAQVTAVFGSANHDAAVFGNDAEDFVLGRPPQRESNYVFGRGDHHCIGAPMAWQVAPIAIESLLAAFPALQVAQAPEPYADPYYRGFRSLLLKR